MINWRKVWMTSSPHGPYRLGYTCATLVTTNMKQKGNFEQIYKSHLSSDYFLKLGNMKMEFLVIVNQHVTVNMFTGLVHTARQAMGAEFT
jgi:hypothetical protein